MGKEGRFDVKTRYKMIQEAIKENHLDNVKCDYYDGLTLDYAKKHNSRFIIRGLRVVSDFDYEWSYAASNEFIDPSIEIVFLMAKKENTFISSSSIVELASNKVDVSKLVPSYVSEVLKEYFNKRNVKISDEAVDELVKRVHGDLTTFSNEATKLMLFKGSSITKDDVISLVSNVLEDDVFSILNNLIINNKDTAIKIYRDLRVQGVEPVTLTSLITTSIIYMLNVKNLSNLGLKADEIAAKTGSSTGRVFMSFKNLKLISEEKLYNVIDNLYDIDYKIKHNLVDRFVIFETFLANFWKK